MEPRPSRLPWQAWIALGCLVLGLLASQLRLPEKAEDPALQEARRQAGLTAMRGPGLEVELHDGSALPGRDPYPAIVHDVDLLALVNELWAAGAEAVAVDGIRLAYGTSVRCVGPTILVNGRRLAAPYTVQALGRPDEMSRALQLPGGFVDSMAPLTRNGGRVLLTTVEELELPPARPFPFELAR